MPNQSLPYQLLLKAIGKFIENALTPLSQLGITVIVEECQCFGCKVFREVHTSGKAEKQSIRAALIEAGLKGQELSKHVNALHKELDVLNEPEKQAQVELPKYIFKISFVASDGTTHHFDAKIGPDLAVDYGWFVALLIVKDWVESSSPSPVDLMLYRFEMHFNAASAGHLLHNAPTLNSMLLDLYKKHGCDFIERAEEARKAMVNSAIEGITSMMFNRKPDNGGRILH